MSATTYDVTSDSSYTDDNAVFNVLNPVNLTITGSLDTVVLPSRADNGMTDVANISVTGDNNAVVGSATSGFYVSLSGTGNGVQLGANNSVLDSGTNNTITLGAGGNVYAGSGSTINATAGRTSVIFQFSGGTANADNDSITVDASSAQVNGNGNNVYVVSDGGIAGMLDLEGNNNTVSLRQGWWGDNVTVGGSNNSISFDANSGYPGAVLIQDASGNMLVEEDTSGAIWFSSASFHLGNGVVTLGFSNGNTVTISNVRSNVDGSGLTAVNQTNQLVSAMASYSAGVGSGLPTLLGQSAEAPLLASTQH